MIYNLTILMTKFTSHVCTKPSHMSKNTESILFFVKALKNSSILCEFELSNTNSMRQTLWSVSFKKLGHTARLRDRTWVMKAGSKISCLWCKCQLSWNTLQQRRKTHLFFFKALPYCRFIMFYMDTTIYYNGKPVTIFALHACGIYDNRYWHTSKLLY